MKEALIAGIALAVALAHAAGVYDVRAFGAKGDGVAKDTAAVQRALDACAGTGGRVVVPPGTYLIGSVFLGDATELHLEKGATLLGSPDLADYNDPDAYPQNFGSKNEGWSAKHLILAIEKRGVSITGRGAIDGNGRAFFADKPEFRGKVCWRDGGINAKDRKHQGRPGQEIVFIECRDVSVRDVTFRDMSCWSCFFHGCENVAVGDGTIRDVRISDMRIEHSGRGLHVQCCYGRQPKKGVDISDVRFERVTIRDTAQAILVGAGSPLSKAKLGDIGFDGVDAEGELPFTVAGDGETRVHGVSFANCTFRPVRSREGQVADREAGKLSGDGAGAIRVERADGVSFRTCTLRWDGGADPVVTRACSLHDAAAPSIDAASSLRDRP